MSFSIPTLIGFLVGISLFIYAIISDPASDARVFLSFNSLLMVIGGTIAATFISYRHNYLIS